MENFSTYLERTIKHIYNECELSKGILEDVKQHDGLNRADIKRLMDYYISILTIERKLLNNSIAVAKPDILDPNLKNQIISIGESLYKNIEEIHQSLNGSLGPLELEFYIRYI